MFSTVFFGGASLVPVNAEIRFTSPTEKEVVTDEGVINFAWKVSGDEWSDLFELQQSASAGFAETRMLYRGPDRGSVVSGLEEGDYHFRVRAVEEGGALGEWSQPIHVQVRYMARTKVFVMLSLGAMVFVATITALFAGHLRSTPGKETG